MSVLFEAVSVVKVSSSIKKKSLNKLVRTYIGNKNRNSCRVTFYWLVFCLFVCFLVENLFLTSILLPISWLELPRSGSFSLSSWRLWKKLIVLLNCFILYVLDLVLVSQSRPFLTPPPNYVFDLSVQLRIIYIVKRLHVLLECCVD